MLRTLPSVVVVTLIGLVAQPAIAGDSGAADASRGTVTRQQDQAPANTGPEAAVATGHEGSYRWDKTGVVRPPTVSLPDDRAGPMQAMMHVASALLLIVLVVFGLTITFMSLRQDMKERRVAYRRRVRRSNDGSAQEASASPADAPH